MPTFEYKILVPMEAQEETEGMLNHFGAHGWELVAAYQAQASARLILKKQTGLQEQEPTGQHFAWSEPRQRQALVNGPRREHREDGCSGHGESHGYAARDDRLIAVPGHGPVEGEWQRH